MHNNYCKYSPEKKYKKSYNIPMENLNSDLYVAETVAILSLDLMSTCLHMNMTINASLN